MVGTDVNRLFASVAPKYDLVNSVLSLGIHHYWRYRALNLLTPKKDGRVLDLCTGTGALVAPLSKLFGGIVAADFCAPMLDIGRKRSANAAWGRQVEWVEADAMNLAFADATFDAATVAFGVRNFESLQKGLGELLRVLKPGGEAVVLEFGQPTIPVWSSLYRLYSRFILPKIGGWLSGDAAAYSYLPETASRFPSGSAFCAQLEEAGFVVGRHLSLTGGICHAYFAKRPHFMV